MGSFVHVFAVQPTVFWQQWVAHAGAWQTTVVPHVPEPSHSMSHDALDMHVTPPDAHDAPESQSTRQFAFAVPQMTPPVSHALGPAHAISHFVAALQTTPP